MSQSEQFSKGPRKTNWERPEPIPKCKIAALLSAPLVASSAPFA